MDFKVSTKLLDVTWSIFWRAFSILFVLAFIFGAVVGGITGIVHGNITSVGGMMLIWLAVYCVALPLAWIYGVKYALKAHSISLEEPNVSHQEA